MNDEEAKAIAKTMTYKQAIYNAMQGKGIPYKKPTKIKLREMAKMLEIAKALDGQDMEVKADG